MKIVKYSFVGVESLTCTKMYSSPRKGTMTATSGVEIRMTTHAANTLNMEPMNILMMLGMIESMVSISLEKRLTRFPLGVRSKKDMGERKTSCSMDWWRQRDAKMPPMEMLRE